MGRKSQVPWSFFGLLAAGAIYGAQKIQEKSEKIEKERQIAESKRIKEEYFKALDEAANEYLKNATDIKLQKEIEREIYEDYDLLPFKRAKLKEKYLSEWTDVIKNFECFDDKYLSDWDYYIYTTDDGKVDYREYARTNNDEVLSFFMAKHGKSPIFPPFILYDYKGDEYDCTKSRISRSCEGFYDVCPGVREIDFEECILEWTLKELKKNGFPYKFRFVKDNDMAVDRFSPDREMIFGDINRWDTRYDAQKYIEENSSVDIPSPKNNPGFFIIDEFRYLYQWGKEREDKDFYNLSMGR